MGIKEALKRVLWGQLGRPSGLRGHVIGKLMTASNALAHELTLSHALLERGDRVLEVGFGGGALVEKALKGVPGITVRGIDASDVMVRQANARNAGAIQEGRAKLLLGSISSLPYGAGTFEKVLSVHSIYFWPDPISDLEEILRVLVPGGYFVVTIDPTEIMEGPASEKLGYSVWSREALLDLLTEAGFVDTGFEGREDPELVCAWGRKPV